MEALQSAYRVGKMSQPHLRVWPGRLTARSGAHWRCNDLQLEINLVYYVDVERGELTPLMDFSQIKNQELFYTQMVNGMPLMWYAPSSAAVSAKGDKLLLYSSASGAGRILAAPLPLDGSPLSLVYEREKPIYSAETRSSVASDGKVVMFETLFTTVEK